MRWVSCVSDVGRNPCNWHTPHMTMIGCNFATAFACRSIPGSRIKWLGSVSASLRAGRKCQRAAAQRSESCAGIPSPLARANVGGEVTDDRGPGFDRHMAVDSASATISA